MLSGNYFVYITTNPKKTVLYIGVTNDLYIRMLQHYQNRGKRDSFSGKFYCYKLVYYERYTSIHHAIEREKEIKNMSREGKEALVNITNPKWNKLAV